MLTRLRSWLSSEKGAPQLPLTGHPPLNRRLSEVDLWPTEEIAQLNELLPWNCFTADTHGRRIGCAAWAGKRTDPQCIPDERIVRLHELVNLSDRHVLEVGCFEGVHTIALCDLAGAVTGLDSRVDNVLKTIVRTALYGRSPDIRLLDVESRVATERFPASDVLFHCGVLYHLNDPVAHLRLALDRTRHAVLLDTHYALEHEATASYESEGRTLRVKDFPESGASVPFAGMYDMARWLRLEDLRAELFRAGFEDVLVEEPRAERNGARVLLIARRSSPAPL